MADNLCTNATCKPGEVVVFFSVGRKGREEAAIFHTDTTSDEVKDLFRSAAEAGSRDILKLWDAAGRLLNISARLPANTADTRYTLEVVAAHCNGMLLDELGVDLRALDERVAQIEKRLRGEADELPPDVQELKQEVDKFRTKLETTEHLSWLGFHNDFPEPLMATMTSRRLQYRRKSSTEKKRVRDKFFNICDLAVSEEVRHGIRRPSFDSCQWEDEEVLVLLQQMFLDLELPARFNIELPLLRNFLAEVYDHYNEVPFHNFRHCFCVAQMMYAMIWCIDLPSKIGYQETLILLTACICHDLDHPGYNNIYQINAGTELALRYNDISPLENHHCSVAFRLLSKPECNFLRCLSHSEFRAVREGIIRCILATDMARHNEILEQFREVTHEFDYRNKAHINLLEMVLIKVADISNEARPMDVAEPWLDRLLQEFFKQSDAEKLEGLPVTPFMDRDKITKPSSQVGFIGLVLLPLFEALGELFNDLQEMIVIPVRDALEYYRRLNDAERLHRKSVVECSISADHAAHLVKSMSVQSRRSFQADTDDSVDTNSNRTDDDNDGDDDDEEDTVTEVEHSEKALTFKISTDGGRCSYPGSRKGSRERQELEFSKMMHSRLTSPNALSSEEDESVQKEISEDLKVLKNVLEETIWELNDSTVELPDKTVQNVLDRVDGGMELPVKHVTSDLERLKVDRMAITSLQKSIGDLRRKSTGEPVVEDVEVGTQSGNYDGKNVVVSTDRATDDSTKDIVGADKCKSVDQNCDSNTGSNVNLVENEPKLSPHQYDLDRKEKKSEPLKPLSLIYRFRNFTDRLSFHQSVDKDSKECSGSVQQTSTSEHSTPRRKPSLDNRATTLPHSRRRRGWRSLIGGGNKVPADQSALIGGGGNKVSVDQSVVDRKNTGNSRKNSAECPVAADHGASSSRLSGSLDSVLDQQVKENNNRKKTASPGFMGRNNWMTSLASSFRSRTRSQHPGGSDEWNK